MNRKVIVSEELFIDHMVGIFDNIRNHTAFVLFKFVPCADKDHWHYDVRREVMKQFLAVFKTYRKDISNQSNVFDSSIFKIKVDTLLHKNILNDIKTREEKEYIESIMRDINSSMCGILVSYLLVAVN